MEDRNIRIVKKNVDILLGSIESHECDPLQECDECGGKKTCKKCDGHGEIDCQDCHASGDCHDCHGHGKERCDDCHGKGTKKCNECGGSGNCRKCGGSGRIMCKKCGGRGQILKGSRQVVCSNCSGSGTVKCPDCSGFLSGSNGTCKKCGGTGDLKCHKCGGSGEIVCKKCNGSGKCKKCNGSGKLTCNHCNGSGACPTCSGTGKITCKRCNGSGWYQTYFKSETTLYAKDWSFVTKTPIKKAITHSSGKIIFHDLYMKWKAANKLEYDKTLEAQKICKDYLGNYADTFDEYVSAYESNKEIKLPASSNDKPYSRRLKVEAIPVTQIEYSINGKDYFLYISGDNHIVTYEEIPTEIHAYSYSFMERLKLSLTENSRIKQYAMLAAYIFQCDGKSKDESKMLKLFIKELKLSGPDEQKFKDKLDQYNSSMPYEVFRKKIKALFSSKKTISFAWQCMAIDKKLSESEVRLFEKLCQEFKNLGSEEIEKLKQYAKRFSRINDDSIVIEYCDISPKSRALRKIAYYVAVLAFCFLIAVIGAIIWLCVVL